MFTMDSRVITFIFCVTMLVHGQFGSTSAAKSECYKLSADIVFVVDSSYSIWPEDYERELTFLRALIDKFTIGQNNIQVGVVSFSSSVRMDFRLNKYTNTRDLKEAVRSIQQMGEGTHTDEAIHFVHTKMFEPVNGGRAWAKKLMVIITDGRSASSNNTLLEASIARGKGIEIFSVLVGRSVEGSETNTIASDPKKHHLFKVDNFKALAGIERSLGSAACQSSNSDGDGKDVDNTDDPSNPTSDACHRSVADVIFLMDSSNSIWKPHFFEQIRFIQQVVSNFDISKDATRVGVIAYSDSPITLVSLTDRQTHAHVNEVLDKAPYMHGQTDTALAIKEARKQLANSNSRHNTAQVIIILSDGQSKNMKETISEANHAHSENVYVFAIGIGNETNTSELMAVASDPDDKFVFYVNNYTALSEIKELVAAKTCDVSMSMQGDHGYASCPQRPTDVLFIYDKVALSRHHHDYVISVITEFMDPNRLNSEELRVGVLREASSGSAPELHDIQLTKDWTQSSFKARLDPDSTTSSIGVLLRRARVSYFGLSASHGHIAHTKTIVIFLDSLLANSHSTLLEALKLRRAHVTIVTVTLGENTNKLQVDGLVSAPKDQFIIPISSVKDYPEYEVVSRLLRVLCPSDESV